MINFEAFFKVSYGLYIVTSGNKEKGNGFISNAVFQVTAEPAQFAACCNKENFTAEFIKENDAFAISVLKQEAGKEIIGTFGYQSGRDINKLDKVRFQFGETGVPIITDDAVAYIECKLKQTFDVGTHLIFIGEVVAANVLSDEDPITYAYYRNIKKGLAPKNAPTYIDKSKLEDKKEKKKEEKKPIGDKYKCPACGYIYDPAEGDEDGHVEPGTSFEDLPDDWVCPVCGVEKGDFMKV